MTITIDPKTGYSPELKARVEAEIARGKTFEPLAAAASQPARKLRRNCLLYTSDAADE